MNRKIILDKQTALRKIERMAFEIYEQNMDAKSIYFVGIKDSGYNLARILKKCIEKISDINIELIELIINKKTCQVEPLNNTKELKQSNIVLVDDVANSGRTLAYSIEPLLAFKPHSIQVAVLVNRMHKRFPITPNYIGLNIATTFEDNIIVESTNTEIISAYLK